MHYVTIEHFLFGDFACLKIIILDMSNQLLSMPTLHTCKFPLNDIKRLRLMVGNGRMAETYVLSRNTMYKNLLFNTTLQQMYQCKPRHIVYLFIVSQSSQFIIRASSSEIMNDSQLIYRNPASSITDQISAQCNGFLHRTYPVSCV